MHSYRKRSLSSSTDEDLQSLFIKKHKKEDLFACEIVTCEFCDEAFFNRYNYLVHNAKHIIIPLLRKTYFRCQECQLQCRTNKKLKKHMKKLHPYITNSHHNTKRKDSVESAELIEHIVINNNSNTHFDNENNDMISVENEIGVFNRENSILPNVSLVNKNSNLDVEIIEINQENSILPNVSLVNENSNLGVEIIEINQENSIIPNVSLVNENSNLGVEIIEIESDDDVKDEFVGKGDQNQIMNADTMRNRLIFEDEEEDIINPNGLITDLVADIKVSVPLESWMSSIADEKKNEEPKEIVDTDLDKIWTSKTVSYQELIKMENVTCKYCKEIFPNRLSVIKHQTCHITSKRRHPFLCQYCDWYVASDPQTLRKHHIRSHPERETKPMNNALRKTCELCKLKYISKLKHMRNYHRSEIEESNDDQEEKKDISKPHFMKKTIKICDLCVSFLKDVPNNVYYKNIGEVSVSGQRQTCGRCLKQYFSINLVEITSRPKFMGQRKPKYVSNMERLKNFQKRLILLNKIRKYLILFYLLLATRPGFARMDLIYAYIF